MVLLDELNLENREASALTRWLLQSLRQSRMSALHLNFFINFVFMIESPLLLVSQTILFVL